MRKKIWGNVFAFPLQKRKQNKISRFSFVFVSVRTVIDIAGLQPFADAIEAGRGEIRQDDDLSQLQYERPRWEKPIRVCLPLWQRERETERDRERERETEVRESRFQLFGAWLHCQSECREGRVGGGNKCTKTPSTWRPTPTSRRHHTPDMYWPPLPPGVPPPPRFPSPFPDRLL